MKTNTTRHRHDPVGCRAWLVLVLMLFAIRAQSAPTVVAWGDNANGQLDLPNTLSNVSTIAAGGFFNLALRSNGTVVVWGTAASGLTNVPTSATNVMAISAGFSHALVLRSNGTMVVWGDNSLGGQTNMPPGLTGIKAIAACGFHSLAVRTNGMVVAWGYNMDGQTNVPASATNIASVAGGYASIALRSNGTVVAGESTQANQANVLPTLTNISAIASGLSHALALRSNGTVVAWGDNFYQQTNLPFGLANVAAIGCGAYHSFAIESNGFMYVWGRDTHNQVNAAPQPFNGVFPAVGGDFHSLAMGYLNDNFADRMPLSGTNILIKANNQNATTEYGFGEPFHHDTFTGHTVWFTWTAPASGGVVIAATNTDFTVNSPILAVYTGSTLDSLAQLASNSADFNVARAVFTAIAGQTYQIVFAGGSDSGGGQGNAYLTLKLSPPPANDLFANATTVAGNYYGQAGSFIGASPEPSEPAHGDSTLGQTLWWNWTAPTNAPDPVSVRLMADGVSFPPGVGVYTGNAVASLSVVTLTMKTNGMTTDATFNAVPGTSYRIALAGKQTDPDSTAPVVGNFRFRFNLRALALSITNLTARTNTTPGLHYGEVSFQADAQVQNLGATTSGPLRVSVSAISGLSTTQPISSTPVSTITNLSITNLPSPLTPGQSTLAHISGVAPAPQPAGGFDQSKILAYGVYAELQEQPVANRWFTVDQTLVTFDDWPAIGNVVGPGGGVIRLDPDYLGLSAFNPLQTVIAVGPASVTEGTSANYTGKATFADATIVNFTNTAWTASRFTIATNGLFTSGKVTSNSVVTINAPYSSQGLIHNATTNVTVINHPPPALTNLGLLGNAGIVFTLSGVPGRSHVIEATTNLAAPAVWLPLITNAPASGLFNFTNFSRTNFPHRFYRGREFE